MDGEGVGLIVAVQFTTRVEGESSSRDGVVVGIKGSQQLE